ncbi:MAG: hypothetical protein KKG76_07790 [Euryarchaeota archaeon]|nr:hypothetical protein [Euryarchaeota archaeon]MBU4138591.1 hypothetical protein [Euryarchaeota archaeon]
MGTGFPDDSKLITCDIDPETTEIAKKYWSRSPNGKKIELKLGQALETLKTIEGLFDLVFIDADKMNYINYWELCLSIMTCQNCFAKKRWKIARPSHLLDQTLFQIPLP